MVRFLVIAALLVFAWLVLLRLFKHARASNLDWAGIVFIVGFVALAFYLRDAAGLG